MKKTPISQPSNKEKEELQAFLNNIKIINKIKYFCYGSALLIFLILKLLGIYPVPWLALLIVVFLLAHLFIWDLVFRKTKAKESITRATIFYFIFQVIELVSILMAFHVSGVISFVGSIVIVLVGFSIYFSGTKRNHSWALIIFLIIGYMTIITLEYLGILEVKDFHNIGIKAEGNQGLFMINLVPGIFLMLLIFSVVDFFSNKLRNALMGLSKRGKELEKTKGELEKEKASLEIKVKERTEELETERASLEEKIKERTKELQERIDELEKFHKVTVGRELKMVELKEEIEKLNKELKKYKG